MVSLDELITSRRSIRKYKKEIPDETQIRKMIYCATFCPSPSNIQPVRFVRIRSQEMRDKLGQEMIRGRDRLLEKLAATDDSRRLKNTIHAYFRFSEFMVDAPVLMAVGTINGTESFSKKLHVARIIEQDVRRERDLDISVGLSLKVLLLKAREFGLGACILSAPLTFVPDIGQVLGVADITIKCFLTIGFPDESPRFIERKKIDEIYQEL